MEQILYRSEVYQIVGACMEVYNNLGYGFLEVVYKDAMEVEFLQRSMNYVREEKHAIEYKGVTLQHKFFADYTLFSNIIVEVKVNKDGITDDAVAQTLNYLKASGLRLGLIINFGKSALDYKRLIF